MSKVTGTFNEITFILNFVVDGKEIHNDTVENPTMFFNMLSMNESDCHWDEMEETMTFDGIVPEEFVKDALEELNNPFNS